MLARLLSSALISATLVGGAWAQDTAQPEPFVLDDGSSAEPQVPAPRAEVSLNSADADDLRALILDTLVENPDVLVQALTLINDKQVEARAAIEARDAHVRDVATNAIGAPVTGNPDGDVTIVFFSDYNCPSCRAAYAALDSVVKADGNVRVVHREMPTNGPDSTQAAKAALAADRQGRYDAFHRGMMALDAPVTTQSILQVALASSIDLNKLLVEQEDSSIVAQLDDTRSLSVDFGFQGAPAFFIGTMVASGQPSETDLREAIAKERERQAERAASQ